MTQQRSIFRPRAVGKSRSQTERSCCSETCVSFFEADYFSHFRLLPLLSRADGVCVVNDSSDDASVLTDTSKESTYVNNPEHHEATKLDRRRTLNDSAVEGLRAQEVAERDLPPSTNASTEGKAIEEQLWVSEWNSIHSLEFVKSRVASCDSRLAFVRGVELLRT